MTNIQKVCKKCNQSLDLICFSFQNKAQNLYKPYCKECVKNYNKTHYKENTKQYIDNANKWKTENREKFLVNQTKYNNLRQAEK
jgi:hypothetical protein